MTQTMENSAKELQKAAFDITNAIKKLTPDFQVGFGTFSDKPTIPFSRNKQDLLDNGKKVPSAFRNMLNLTNLTSEFENKVRATEFVSNVDSPESGFDAIGQAMACQNLIGWRPEAQKVIVFIAEGKKIPQCS